MLFGQLYGLVVRNSGEGDDHPLWSEESVSIGLDHALVDGAEAILWAEQRITEGVVLEGRGVNQLGQDELRLGPYFGDLILGCEQLLLHLLLCELWVPYCFGEQANRGGNGVVECGGLVHHSFSRGRALDVSTEVFHLFQDLIGGVSRGRLEGQPVHDVACAAKVSVLVPRPGVYVDPHA